MDSTSQYIRDKETLLCLLSLSLSPGSELSKGLRPVRGKRSSGRSISIRRETCSERLPPAWGCRGMSRDVEGCRWISRGVWYFFSESKAPVLLVVWLWFGFPVAKKGEQEKKRGQQQTKVACRGLCHLIALPPREIMADRLLRTSCHHLAS